MTIKQLIYNVRGQLKISRPDDLSISDRQIEFMINYIREMLIVQQLQKGRSISSNITQDLGQVPVKYVDRGADGFLVSGESIFRTVNKVPKPMELDQMDAFTYIGGIDRQSSIPFKTKANAKWNKYNKYASKQPLAYYYNGYIYITGCENPLLEYINIEGIFSNPREVFNFQHPDGNPCYNPDVDDYPMSGRMVATLNKIIKTEELGIFLQIAEKSTNDASSER